VEKNNDEMTKKVDSLADDHAAEFKNVYETTTALSKKMEIYKKTFYDEIVNLRKTITTLSAQNQALMLANNASSQRIVLLSSQMETLERATHGGLQHGRGWNVELDGIPAEVGDDRRVLKKAVLSIVKGIGVDIQESDIEMVHRLPARKDHVKPTIVRFHGREVVHDIHDNKKKLKNLRDCGIVMEGLNDNSRIFIRASQSPYHKTLSYNCRVLKRAKMIADVVVGKEGKTSIKTLEGRFVKILHASDLTSRFPDFPDFSFNADKS
jgi:hypothetical protein